jgi:predicted transcriptional regulator
MVFQLIADGVDTASGIAEELKSSASAVSKAAKRLMSHERIVPVNRHYKVAS